MLTSKCAVKKPRKSRVIRWTRKQLAYVVLLAHVNKSKSWVKSPGRSPYTGIHAQLIAPNGSEVLAAASTAEKSVREGLKSTGNVDAAKVVGKTIAERAIEKGVKSVSFDRSGFKYHGRVAALADAAREAGLQF